MQWYLLNYLNLIYMQMTPIVTVPLLLFVYVVRKISLSFVTSNFLKNHSVKKDKIKCKLMQRKIK